ncbi:unnamed protein product [Phytomonas sp. Hart1]|nr:unnamed protein product [Phytomonas sp. Hart1]|eukprot:CCW70213.1 unnamed protein product [Phytomonas sp. isolate Hart1]
MTKTVIFMEAMPPNLEVIRYYAQRRDIEVSMIVLSLNGWVGNLNAAYENIAAFLKLLYNEGYSKRIPLYYGNSLAEVDFDFFIHFDPSIALSSQTTVCSFRRLLSNLLELYAEVLFGAAFDLRQVDIGDMAMRPSFFEQPLSAFLSENEANFLVLGPCTDAAWFLQNHNEHHARVSNIVVAGGTFLDTGDTYDVIMRNKGVEMNFFFDPQAANYLMQGTHGRPVTLIPMDAAMPWRPSVYDAIINNKRKETSGGSAVVLAKALYAYHQFLDYYASEVSLSVVAAAYNADAYLQDGARGILIPVQVLYGNSTFIGGLSIRPKSGDFKVKVVLELDYDKFFNHLINVNSLSLA